uniref:Uncharacterized protein n=1 Tax=Cucumis melo TaxID=3656 RepID=A0A9I9E9Z1_CUCME
MVNNVDFMDFMRVCFTTKNGTLLELSELEPPRWVDHGQPRDANVAAIADVACFRTEIMYTITFLTFMSIYIIRLSSMGDFYEYDTNSKPLWKKHADSDDDGLLTLKDMIENPFVFYSPVF